MLIGAERKTGAIRPARRGGAHFPTPCLTSALLPCSVHVNNQHRAVSHGVRLSLIQRSRRYKTTSQSPTTRIPVSVSRSHLLVAHHGASTTVTVSFNSSWYRSGAKAQCLVFSVI